MFNAVELLVHLFRLIAGHVPKPVKLRDVLQYILRIDNLAVEKVRLKWMSARKHID